MTFQVDGGIEWEYDSTVSPPMLTIRPSSTPESGYVSGQMKNYSTQTYTSFYETRTITTAPWAEIIKTFRGHDTCSLTIDYGITYVGNYAFFGCSAFFVPSGTTGLVSYGVTVVYIWGDQPTVGAEAFSLLDYDCVPLPIQLHSNGWANPTTFPNYRTTTWTFKYNFYYFAIALGDGKIYINGVENDKYSFIDKHVWKFELGYPNTGSYARAIFTDTSATPVQTITVDVVPDDAEFGEVRYAMAYFNNRTPVEQIDRWWFVEFNHEYSLSEIKGGTDESGTKYGLHFAIMNDSEPDPQYCRFRFKEGFNGKILVDGEESTMRYFDWPFENWKFKKIEMGRSIGKLEFNYTYKDRVKSATVVAEYSSPDISVKIEGYKADGSGLQTIETGVEYKLSDFKLEDLNGGFLFSGEYIPPEKEDYGPFPVVFYDLKGNKLFEDLNNNVKKYDWTKPRWTSEGQMHAPTKFKWQKYQNSYFINVGVTEVVLDRVANVFYMCGDGPIPSDNMRMIIKAPTYGELDLGEIQSITDKYDAKLSPIPIVVYGFTKGFCMDLGTTRSITVNGIRSQPETPNNTSPDSRDWSNAAWQAQLKALMNRWQMRTNGVHLYQYLPGAASTTGDMSECYPEINPAIPETGKGFEYWVNAYILNSTNTYKPTYLNHIEYSISFQIGTIYPKPIPYMSAPVKFKIENLESPSVIVNCPLHSMVPLPYCQNTLVDYMGGNSLFAYWVVGSGESAKKMYPGDALYIGSTDIVVNAHFYTGKFKKYIGTGVISKDMFMDHERYDVFLVGGGGGGSGPVKSDDPIESAMCTGGGGGGAGGFAVLSFEYNVDISYDLFYVCGKGGDAGAIQYGVPGKDGESTYITPNSNHSSKIFEALGGKGGGANTGHGGAGGLGGGYDAHGSSAYGRSGSDGGKGGDCFYSWPDKWWSDPGVTPAVKGGCRNAGRGGDVGYITVVAIERQGAGGGGGGAPPVVNSDYFGFGGRGATAGDGDKGKDSGEGINGGGGGGGAGFVDGPFRGPSKGGDGYIVIFGKFNG